MLIDLSDECLAFQPDFDMVIDHESLTVQFIDQTTGNPNQWLWGFGDANTSNEQNPEHTYNQMGDYNVCLLVQNTDLGCNESYCQTIEVGTVSTTEIAIRNFSLKIYPNPSPKHNTIWVLEGILEKDYQKKLQLKMYDVQGRTVFKSEVQGAEKIALNLKDELAGGIYFIELRGVSGVYRGKIIAQ